MAKALKLYLDAETRSAFDLRAGGSYPYFRHPTTDCLLAAWAVGKDKPRLWHRGETLPAELRDAMLDPAIRICAHNFTFERGLLTNILAPRYGWPDVGLDRWDCTMARARACNLPASLEQALAALDVGAAKDAAGHRLMLQMCKPRDVAADGTITWWEDEQRIKRLGEYCARDIMGGRVLDQVLPELSPAERAVWLETEEINDVGVRFDLAFCRRALEVADIARDHLDREMRHVTHGVVKKASNVSALKAWVEIDHGIDIRPPEPPPPPLAPGEEELVKDGEQAFAETMAVPEEIKDTELRRRDVERLLLQPDALPEEVVRALQIRLEAGKTSTKKLNSILARADAEGRVRGLLAYHGAGTGRFSAAGSGVQIQNFPREVVADWDGAWAVLEEDGYDGIETLYGPSLDVISRMLRGGIIPTDGYDIINLDYAGVEARGVAWLAGCDTLVAAFASGAKIYEQMAGRVFNVPAKDIGKDSLERFVGKTLVLGCGYQMSWFKFMVTLALQGRLIDEAVARLGVATYRSEFSEIPDLWYEMERQAIAAVRHPGLVALAAGGRIAFRLDGKWLRLRLPSGRELRYRDPKLEPNERFPDRDKLTYLAVNSLTKRWERQSTYGGRLTENAVQGLCRDLLVAGVRRLRAAGYRVVTSVHDEIICEAPTGDPRFSVAHANQLMCALEPWATGFPLSAEGRRGSRYRK